VTDESGTVLPFNKKGGTAPGGPPTAPEFVAPTHPQDSNGHGLRGEDIPDRDVHQYFVSVKQAARILGMGTTYVEELLYAGQLCSYKFGRSRRISLGDLTEWVSRQKERP
jgi:excisionase family DNA binding protein